MQTRQGGFFRQPDPPEYWADEVADLDEIKDNLIEKYRTTATAELDALLAAGEIDEYTEADVEFTALEIAAEYGETPDRIVAQYHTDRAEWLAGFSNDY